MHRLRWLEIIVVRASIQTKRNLLQLLLNCNGNSSGNEWILLHLAKKYDTFWPVGTLKRVIALICAQVFELTFISTTDVWLLIPIDHIKHLVFVEIFSLSLTSALVKSQISEPWRNLLWWSRGAEVLLLDLILHVDSNERKTLREYLDDHADILEHYNVLNWM